MHIFNSIRVGHLEQIVWQGVITNSKKLILNDATRKMSVTATTCPSTKELTEYNLDGIFLHFYLCMLNLHNIAQIKKNSELRNFLKHYWNSFWSRRYLFKRLLNVHRLKQPYLLSYKFKSSSFSIIGQFKNVMITNQCSFWNERLFYRPFLSKAG